VFGAGCGNKESSNESRMHDEVLPFIGEMTFYSGQMIPYSNQII
jgi:hypothetical protein